MATVSKGETSANTNNIVALFVLIKAMNVTELEKPERRANPQVDNYYVRRYILWSGESSQPRPVMITQLKKQAKAADSVATKAQAIFRL
ncbi:MAG: hypothetical protein JO066_00940, partial [Verrucomicrobia bacterium]|nr:hypothetical protein [Verrucomicrobiota bacterium]